MASKAQGEETRARLVRAALDLFAERGARGTSLDAVAAAAGVTRQGLLHYFPSKTELLLAVLEQRDQDDRAAVTPAVAQSGGLTGALLTIMRHNRENPGLTQLSSVAEAEGAKPGDPTHEYFRERYVTRRGELAHPVRRLQEHGLVTTDLDAEQVSAALLALLYGLNLQQLLEPDVDHIATLEGVLRLIIKE